MVSMYGDVMYEVGQRVRYIDDMSGEIHQGRITADEFNGWYRISPETTRAIEYEWVHQDYITGTI